MLLSNQQHKLIIINTLFISSHSFCNLKVFKIEVYQFVQFSHCQHQCPYCYLSVASSINKAAEVYSKVKTILFNYVSNYHYLITKKSYSSFSSFSSICCYITWDTCGSSSSAEAAYALPNSLKKLSHSWVRNGGQVKMMLSFQLCWVNSQFLAKTRMLSLSFH